MFGWGESKNANDQLYNGDFGEDHKASLSHEVIAGGAAFEAFKAFENHQRAEGKTVNHAFAKEALVGLAGAEIDKLFETKGLDMYDREKAKRQAKEQAQKLYDDHYGGQEQYDPNSQQPPSYLQ